MIHKNTLISAAVMAAFVLIGAAAFPVYNLTKEYDSTMTLLMMAVPIALYCYLGRFESTQFKAAGPLCIAALNLGLTAASLICRYLLEFGEVSNLYNFTLPNVCLHITAALTVSMAAWYTHRNRRRLF